MEIPFLDYTKMYYWKWTELILAISVDLHAEHIVCDVSAKMPACVDIFISNFFFLHLLNFCWLFIGNFVALKTFIIWQWFYRLFWWYGRWACKMIVIWQRNGNIAKALVRNILPTPVSQYFPFVRAHRHTQHIRCIRSYLVDCTYYCLLLYNYYYDYCYYYASF